MVERSQYPEVEARLEVSRCALRSRTGSAKGSGTAQADHCGMFPGSECPPSALRKAPRLNTVSPHFENNNYDAKITTAEDENGAERAISGAPGIITFALSDSYFLAL